MPKLLFTFQSRTDSIDFDTSTITAEKAKQLIAKKIDTLDQLDLKIGGQSVGPGQILIPGSSVTVYRLAQQGFAPRPKFGGPIPTGEIIGIATASTTPITFRTEQNLKMPGGYEAASTLHTARISESERIEQLRSQVGHETAPAFTPNFMRRPDGPRGGAMGGGGMMMGSRGGMNGPPPPNYVCDLCAKGGHWITDCPSRRLRGGRGGPPMASEGGRGGGGIKRAKPPVGIPHASLEVVEDPESCQDVLFRLPNGKFARRRVNEGSFQCILQGDVAGPGEVPDSVKCVLCAKLVSEAVMVPCCPFVVQCGPCLDAKLDEAADDPPPRCPHCHKPLALDDIVPHEGVQRRVSEHLCKAVAVGTVQKGRGVQAVVGDSAGLVSEKTPQAQEAEEECW